MLKIGKGLKKKKKSKKKHKDEELFTEAELEQYRREHASKTEEEGTSINNTETTTSETKPVENSEEFEKFKQLTAGVDDILKKTQGDLDRIKKESFFQRKPTPSELQKLEEEKRRKEEELRKLEEDREAQEKSLLHVEENLEESESEYEFDDGDDLFDTAYVEALESGEVKLAYVPDDDEEVDDGPDPFDTTTAEVILKKSEEEEKRKKKEIKLGAAVQVLTGRAERDRSLLPDSESKTGVDSRRPRTRPRKIQDLSLLGSFDDNGNLPGADKLPVSPIAVEAPKSLLDDDLDTEVELPEGETLLKEVLVKNIVEKNTEPILTEPAGDNLKTLVEEFDVINEERVSDDVKKAGIVDDEFDEFTALAESSILNQKLEEELQQFEIIEDDPFDTSAANVILEKKQESTDPFGEIEPHLAAAPELQVVANTEQNQNWTAFEEKSSTPVEVDPFDTSFVADAQPGKFELKLIENEVLGATVTSKVKQREIYNEARILSRSDSDVDFNPREGENWNPTPSQLIQQRIAIQITDPAGFVETRESESDNSLVSLTLGHRDLLGGSSTDLSSLAQEPISPKPDSPTEDYSDPFDTSVVEQVIQPGKAELAFLEKELLADFPSVTVDVLKDDEFNPREEEEFVVKQVQFDIPSPINSDLLGSEKEGIRPLTPYYADPSSEIESSDIEDPFDTSHVISLPSKVELRFIEKELETVENTIVPAVVAVEEKLGLNATELNVTSGLKHSLSDQDFNPRDEEVKDSLTAVNASRRFSDFGARTTPSSLTLREQPTADLDLLEAEEELPTKVLTPAVEEDISAYIDPFDTTIAENIAPGKAELKVLESELFADIGGEGTESGLKRSYTDPDFNPRDERQNSNVAVQKEDILDLPEEIQGSQLLTPLDIEKVSQELTEEDIDPFDTSIALNILPGKAELRLLESELIGQ